MSEFDSIVDGEIFNPDTLKQKNRGFKLKTKLSKKDNLIWIDMNVENQYGKKKSGTLLETIRTKN